ncbi:MAG: plasmid stabilization protein [Parvibaculum sp.]|nr:plasmid stabilization protein [Parvibaculum sp.]
MAVLTVRNIPDEVHRALRVRAALHGRSIEAEVREILAAAVRPEERLRVGDALADIGRKIGLTNEDFAVLESVRDKTPESRELRWRLKSS